jgi:hypothetical protein
MTGRRPPSGLPVSIISALAPASGWTQSLNLATITENQEPKASIGGQGHRQSRVVVITSFLDRWSGAEEVEDLVEAVAHFLGGLFDVGPAGEAEEADRDVSHGGHDLGGGAGSDLGSVFVEGDVADIVLAVLYSPMSAVEGEDVGGVGLVGGEAGDESEANRGRRSYERGLPVSPVPVSCSLSIRMRTASLPWTPALTPSSALPPTVCLALETVVAT